MHLLLLSAQSLLDLCANPLHRLIGIQRCYHALHTPKRQQHIYRANNLHALFVMGGAAAAIPASCSSWLLDLFADERLAISSLESEHYHPCVGLEARLWWSTWLSVIWWKPVELDYLIYDTSLTCNIVLASNLGWCKLCVVGATTANAKNFKSLSDLDEDVQQSLGTTNTAVLYAKSTIITWPGESFYQ